MNPLQLNKLPGWYRYMDGLVIMVIGVVLGIVLSQAVTLYEAETVTTTRVIRSVPLRQQDDTTQTGQVDAPKDPVNIQEI